ncbi:MAG: DUF1579 family protein [Planctomycetes bacterium]|nr:DUF1579 family protein [Planctomycetota bacterium]
MLFRSFAALSLATTSVLLLVSPSSDALTTPSVQDEAQAAQMQEMMKKAARYTQPGPHHKKLERMLGTWNTSTRFVMGGRKSPPEKGTSEVSWMMDGRWLQMRWKGAMMGRGVEGCTLLGYDNFKMSYVSTGISTMDTAMTRSEGDMTPDDKALVLYGTLDEYLTGEHDKMVRYVYRFESEDTMVLEVHDLPIGLENTLVVEITFERKD